MERCAASLRNVALGADLSVAAGENSDAGHLPHGGDECSVENLGNSVDADERPSDGSSSESVVGLEETTSCLNIVEVVGVDLGGGQHLHVDLLSGCVRWAEVPQGLDIGWVDGGVGLAGTLEVVNSLKDDTAPGNSDCVGT